MPRALPVALARAVAEDTPIPPSVGKYSRIGAR
jgi:hypothetical protein